MTHIRVDKKTLNDVKPLVSQKDTAKEGFIILGIVLVVAAIGIALLI